MYIGSDTQMVNPLFYSIDNSYWNIGKQIGEGFNEGKNIMNKN